LNENFKSSNLKNMDELSDYTSMVIGFTACDKKEKKLKVVNSGTTTDPSLPKTSVSVQTLAKISQETQTEIYQGLIKNIDERKLGNWLRKIYPNIEKELLQGTTPLMGSNTEHNSLIYLEIQPYQKISIPAVVNSQGLAIWLMVHTHNAPALVVTTIASHDDWCEHVEQCLKLFIPIRMPNGSFVTYNEIKSIPLKACMKSLCTNSFNKNIFAGSTHDGDIYIWKYEQHYHSHSTKRSTIDISEMHHTTALYGFAVAMDWSSENTLLTAHTNGYVLQWNISKDIIKEAEYFIKSAVASTTDISALLCISLTEFIIGAKDGSIFHCSYSSLSSMKRHLEIISLKKHLFMISSLLKANINGYLSVISCDLSGQVYLHDLRNLENDSDTIVVQLPLTFTSTVATSRDGSIIYSAGDDGSLECYNLNSGIQHTVKGLLKGKGNFIKSSENG
ncbi:hypothetical protein DOY81_008684, partial [Sarcophaga bullata]